MKALYHTDIVFYCHMFEPFCIFVFTMNFVQLPPQHESSCAVPDNGNTLTTGDETQSALIRSRSTSSPSINENFTPQFNQVKDESSRLPENHRAHRPLEKTLSDQHSSSTHTTLNNNEAAGETKASWRRRLSVKVGFSSTKPKQQQQSQPPKAQSALPSSTNSTGFFSDQQNISKGIKLKIGKQDISRQAITTNKQASTGVTGVTDRRLIKWFLLSDDTVVV